MNIKAERVAGMKAENRRLHLIKLEDGSYMIKIKKYDPFLKDMKIYSEDLPIKAECKRGVQEISLRLSKTAMQGLATMLSSTKLQGEKNEKENKS